MNSKPTKKKVIWSIVLAIIINAGVPLVNWLTTTITWPLIQNYLNASKLEGISAPSTIQTLTSYMLSTWNIIVFILELIIIYLIWSIFQRKRQPKMQIKK